MMKISVCCITYNHGKFLAQAIESVLQQKTDFEVELVIGEDCSTDDTRAVALKYQSQHPAKIKVLAHAQNMGIIANLVATLASCKGDFIAMLDGDDYWTDPTKIQRQVDALLAAPDCAMCFHDAEVFYENLEGDIWKFSEKFTHLSHQNNNAFQRYTQLDLARLGWFIPTASMMFRAVSLPQPLPPWFIGVFGGDFTLQLLSTRWGPALYLPRVMSRYRLHEHSITNSTLRQPEYRFERSIYEGKMFQKYVFEPQYRKHANIYLSTQYLAYARYLGSTGQRWQQLQYLAKASFYGRQHLPLFIMRRLGQLFTPVNHS